MQVIMELLVDCEFEAEVARRGGWVLGDAQFLVAETHDAVVVLVLGAVDGKEVVELVEELF